MLASPDKKISLTDPDSRSMATKARGSGVVGYNVQTAVDTTHHLIVAHDVRSQPIGYIRHLFETLTIARRLSPQRIVSENNFAETDQEFPSIG